MRYLYFLYKHTFFAFSLFIFFCFLDISLFAQEPSARVQSEMERVSSVVRKFHQDFNTVLYSDRFYLREEVDESYLLDNKLRNLYRIRDAQNEYIMAAYDDAKTFVQETESSLNVVNDKVKNWFGYDLGIGENSTEKNIQESFQTGVVFTNKGIYARVDETGTHIRVIKYSEYGQKYGEIRWSDEHLAVLNKKGDVHLIIPLVNSPILPAEMAELVKKLVHVFTKEGIRQLKAEEARIRATARVEREKEKKRLIAAEKEKKRVTDALSLASSHFEKREYNQSFNILNEHKDSQYFDNYYYNLLGVMYLDGLGTQKNLDFAEKYLRKADLEDAVTKFNLGYLYSEKGDDISALAWMKESGEKGFALANLFVGNYYFAQKAELYKNDFQRSMEIASHYYNEAAEAGNKDAMKAMSELYKKLSNNAYASHSEWMKRDGLEFDRKEERKKNDSYLGQLGDWYTRSNRKKEFLEKKSLEYTNLASHYYRLSLEWNDKANATN